MSANSGLGAALCITTAVVSILNGVPTLELAAQTSYVARITSVVEWKLDESTFRALTAEDRAALERRGMKIVDQSMTLQSPELPLAGYWLEFRETRPPRHRTDKDGYIRLPTKPAVTKDVKVFVEAIDTEPFGVLETVTFVPEADKPPASRLRLPYAHPGSMDPPDPPPGAAAGALPGIFLAATNRDVTAAGTDWRPTVLFQPPPAACGTKKKCRAKSNEGGCCLDYNGPRGDGHRYIRDPSGKLESTCNVSAGLNFIGSTCFEWSFLKSGRACLRERAILQVMGPKCFDNHKYRNCQNMDDTDFAVTPRSQTIKFGETATIKIRNNTSANDSAISFVARPQATAALVQRGATRLLSSPLFDGYVLEHFVETVVPKRHSEDASVTFTAPASPVEGQCAETYSIKVAGGPNADVVDVRVEQSPCGYEFSGLRVQWKVESHSRGRWEWLLSPAVEFRGRVCGDPKTSTWWITRIASVKSRVKAADLPPTEYPERPYVMSPSGILTPTDGMPEFIELRLSSGAGDGRIQLHMDTRKQGSVGEYPKNQRTIPTSLTASAALRPTQDLTGCDN